MNDEIDHTTWNLANLRTLKQHTASLEAAIHPQAVGEQESSVRENESD